MNDTQPKPAPSDDDGVTLSPDAPIGEVPEAEPELPVREPTPVEDGIIAPGPTPENR